MEDNDNIYRVGDFTSNNSYDQIKLTTNPTLNSETTSVTIQYSQGKTTDLAIDVFKDIKVSYKKASVDAKTDTFSIKDIGLKGIKDNGDEVDALLNAFLPGQGGARAELNILTGKVDPSGKLTETYPFVYEDSPTSNYFPGKELNTIYRDSIFVGYRYFASIGKKCVFHLAMGFLIVIFPIAICELAKKESALK
ncbi:MAG TPA: hypothetical protein DEF61_02970 [Firmicutes bacterium]|nr:hypothetical protein [Bacillota bacterium]